MSLIDRYIHAVAAYLPKDTCDDVIKELRANIEDMLPENPTENDVYKVLEKLGNPLELANEYYPRKRYLIGPVYYDTYLAILKMVVGICIAVFTGITAVVSILNPSELISTAKVAELFTNIISGVLTGATQGAFWVTLVFVILERSGVESGDILFSNGKWTPDSLPEIPKNDNMKISRKETVFEIICTIIITALLCIQPQLIAIYTKGMNGVLNITPLFEVNRLKSYTVFIFALAVFQLAIFIWKYIAKRWNVPLIAGNTVLNVLLCILAAVMLSDGELFNPGFANAIAELMNGTIDTAAMWFDRGRWIFLVFFIGICIWDSISRLYIYFAKS